MKINQLLPFIGLACITQSHAQTSLLDFLETQGFNDSDSINGTYDLGFQATGLELTITGDGTYREAVRDASNRFGVWGNGSVVFSFNQIVAVDTVLDGRNRPGEVNSWTGNGELVDSFADASFYSITPNSFENISEDFLVEGDVFVNYAATSGFTINITGRDDQPIDLVIDLQFRTAVPEPSAVLLLGLSGLGFMARRKR